MEFKISINDFLEYIIALSVIFICQTVYARLDAGINMRILGHIVLAFVLLVYIIILQSETGLSFLKKDLYKLFIYIVLALFFLMTNAIHNDVSNYSGRFLVILPLFFVLFSLDYDVFYNLLEKVSKIMAIIAIVSLFFWLFGSILHFISPTSNVHTNWAGGTNITSYYNLYFERQIETFFGRRITRNIGCFTETPMYAFCLMIAILAETFLLKNNSKRRFLFYLTMMTTISITGIVLSSGVFVVDYFISHTDQEEGGIPVQTLIVGSIIGIIGIAIGGIVFYQKINRGVGWAGRLSGLQVASNDWRAHFWIGAGFSSSDNERRSDTYKNLITGLGMVVSQGGLLLLVMNVYPFVLCWLKSLKLKGFGGIFWFSLFVFIEFVATAIQYQPILLMVLALLMVYDPESQIETRIAELNDVYI